MARVDDYSTYLTGKSKNFSSEHYFICDLKYTDIIVKGNPPEIMNVDEAAVSRNKAGIDGVDFQIHRIELEIDVDDYPNDKKTFEFEIEPGVNVDPAMVIVDKLDYVIPTYPKRITIDMRKSMEVKDFKVVVEFGRDEYYEG